MTRTDDGGTRLEAAGVWELDLLTMTWRTVADCAIAHYPRVTPCDMKVDWSECPGPTGFAGQIRSELRRLDGTTRPLPAISWVLSPSSYVEVRDAGWPLDEMFVVDAAGHEHFLSRQIDLDMELTWGASVLATGSAEVFAPDLGWAVTDSVGRLSRLPGDGCTGDDPTVWASTSPSGDLLVWSCGNSASPSVEWYAVDLRGDHRRRPLAGLAGARGIVRYWSADGQYFLIELSPSSDADPQFIVSTRTGERVVELHHVDPALGRIVDADLAHPARWY